jgi:hypothetical protein
LLAVVAQSQIDVIRMRLLENQNQQGTQQVLSPDNGQYIDQPMQLLGAMNLPQMLPHMHHMRAQTADSLPYIVFDLITQVHTALEWQPFTRPAAPSFLAQSERLWQLILPRGSKAQQFPAVHALQFLRLCPPGLTRS